MRIIIYTGKGGTGKTVTSCSTAIKLSEYGYKTLILSSDPAHTLSDAFVTKNIGNRPFEVYENLFALQIDPVIELDSHYKPIMNYLVSSYVSRGIDETLSYEISMLPGMTQLFSLLKVEEFVRKSAYDIIVLDMPASGEALRYLYLPKLVGTIGRKFGGFSGVFSSMMRMFQPFFSNNNFSQLAPPSNVLQSEFNLISRLEYLSKVITNVDITSLRLVANPDTFSIENAKRAMMFANLYGINVDLVIVNKILPLGSADRYLANWADIHAHKVQEVHSNFFPLPIKKIELYEKELRGLDMLKANSEKLFGEEDASNVFYSDKIFEFINDDLTLCIKVKVPFTEKDDYQLEHVGDQLIIKVKSITGFLVNIVPLPTATLGMRLLEAKLETNVLCVYFKK